MMINDYWQYEHVFHIHSSFFRILWLNGKLISMVSCQKGPTRYAYAWQIRLFWQDILDIWYQHEVLDITIHRETPAHGNLCLLRGIVVLTDFTLIAHGYITGTDAFVFEFKGTTGLTVFHRQGIFLIWTHFHNGEKSPVLAWDAHMNVAQYRKHPEEYTAAIC